LPLDNVGPSIRKRLHGIDLIVFLVGFLPCFIDDEFSRALPRAKGDPSIDVERFADIIIVSADPFTFFVDD